MIKQRNKNNEYQRKDGFLAIGLFCIMCLLYGLLATLENVFPQLKENNILVGSGFNLILIAVTIVFIKMRKGKLSSTGLYGGKLKQSCLIGLVLAAVLFYTNCLSHIISGAKFVPTKEIVILIMYYLTVAFCEEIVFRGYIGTRLTGLITNRYIAILVSGILFVIMHFPYRMIAYGMSISDLTIDSMGWIIDLYITHIVLSLIYLKTNSLYGAIIPHWMSNLAYNLVDR